MRLVIFTEPQEGARYADLLRFARHAEELGFEGFFRSDHYLAMDTDGLPGPTDAWVTLAGLARETSTIRLGTLVSSATFRLPGPLAIAAAQVDEMSGGRLELGLGTGWFAAEHTAYGIPFPPLRERFDRLAEQLDIVTGLWSTPVGGRYSFGGAHYTLTDAPALPKPVQSPHPPVIVGGKGKTRTAALAARFADEYNVPFGSVAEVRDCYAAVAAAAQAVDRDGAGRPLTLSAALTTVCGRTDAEIARRAAAIGHDPAALRAGGGAAGTPDHLATQLREYADLGATRLFLQILDLADLAHLDLIATEVAPRLP